MHRSLFLIVLSDVDGTLLDRDTYSFAPAAPALERLERERVPLILCSSKTRAEIESLQQELGIRHPFISENGAALFVPAEYFHFSLPGARRLDGYEVIEFGRPYPLVVSALHSAACAVGARVTGFSDMSAEEVAQRSGLSIAQASLAKRREYDEPFIVDERDMALRPALHGRLVARRLRCTSGGRFDHVTGATDKARAAGVLRMLYQQADHRRIVTVGLGDAANDACLLREVQIPVIIRQRAGEQTRQLLSAVPRSRVSRRLGPHGWNEQIEEIVEQVA